MTEKPNGPPTGGACLTRLVRGLREMAKWGTGPCGGGGTLDEFSQGRREAEDRMRKELRRLLKEFESANAPESSRTLNQPEQNND